MRSKPPPMVPLFRSDGQARLLAILFERSREPLTLAQLAAMTNLPRATVHREVARLAEHQMVDVTTVGRTGMVKANWQRPWAEALAALLAQTVGLPDVIGQALSQLPNLEEAVIHGSWAARYLGQPGPAPRDVNLLLIGEIDFAQVREVLAPAERVAGIPIETTAVSPSQWSDRQDPFVHDVLQRAHVQLQLHRP